MIFRNVRFCANCEMKLLMRSVVLKIFTFIVLIFISLYTIAVHTDLVNPNLEYWDKISLSAFVPLFGIIYFNLLQSFILIFLANYSFNTGKTFETNEVLFNKPLSNIEIVFGKVYGILKTFWLLCVLSAVVTLLINIFIIDSNYNVLYYIFYLLTIPFPTLILLVGILLCAKNLFKHQALSNFVLLSLMVMCLIFHKKLNGAIDIFCLNTPTVISDMVGLHDIKYFLFQRGAFLLVGMSLIILSSNIIPRFNNHPFLKRKNYIYFFVLFIAGLSLSICNIHSFKTISDKRSIYIQTYELYQNCSLVSVFSNDLTVEKKGTQLDCCSEMRLINENGCLLDSIVLYLNPALDVIEVTEFGKHLNYKRNNQVIIVYRKVVPNESIDIQLKYRGGLDESICFCDIRDQYRNKRASDVLYHAEENYVFLTDNYTLLTPESIWYPVAMPPQRTSRMAFRKNELTIFNLKVKSINGQEIISQGLKNKQGNDIQFINKFPLPGIALIIGNYKEKSITVDSVKFSLYCWDKTNRIVEFFEPIKDSLALVIKDIVSYQTYIKGRGLMYSQMNLVEVPIGFNSHSKYWKSNTEYILPEMILFPENMTNLGFDVFSTQKQHELQSAYSNRSVSMEETLAQILKNYTRNILNVETDCGWMGSANYQLNKLNISPMYYDFITNIYSDRYPGIQLIINRFLTQTIQGRRRLIEQFVNDDLSNSAKAKNYLSKKSLVEAISDENLSPVILNEIFILKSQALKDYILSQVEWNKFQVCINEFWRQHAFASVSLNTLNEFLSRRLDLDIVDFIHMLYYERGLPALSIQKIAVSSVINDGLEQFQVDIDVRNLSLIGGVYTVEVYDEEWFKKEFYVPSNTESKSSFVLKYKPKTLSISTNVSQNDPSQCVYELDNLTWQNTTRLFIDKEPIDASGNGDFAIIDDVDSTFNVLSHTTKLLSLMNTNDDMVVNRRFNYWRLPNQWTKIVDKSCFGAIVRSAIYKKKGSGNFKVMWNFHVSDEGLYNIFIWNPCFLNNENMQRTQYYTLEYGDGKIKMFEVELNANNQGWVSLGDIHLPKDILSIVLTDKVDGEFVTADAIKLVRLSK